MIYCEHYGCVKEYGISVMTRATYDEKVNLLVDLEMYNGRTKPSDMQNAINRFVWIGKVKGCQLFWWRKDDHTLKVPYYEILFDIIHESPLFLAHAKDCGITKIHIDELWRGIPENAIKIYRNSCPQCLRHSCPSATESLQPLWMIITVTIGSHAQMDLIEYTEIYVHNDWGIPNLQQLSHYNLDEW